MLEHNSLLLIGAILLANAVAIQYLARPLQHWPTAVATALASIVVVMAATLCQQVLQRWVLQPLDSVHLRWMTLLMLVVAGTLFTSALAPSIKPWRLSVHEPLLLSHSALLSIALLEIAADHSFFAGLAYSLAAAAGYALLIILFLALRERVKTADVPLPLRGAAIDLLGAGLVALALMGFAGIF